MGDSACPSSMRRRWPICGRTEVPSAAATTAPGRERQRPVQLRTVTSTFGSMTALIGA